MDRQDLDGLGWSEETVTELSIGAGLPFVKPIPFNRNQEGQVGADWLWWWLDNATEECFGMLVQAKRLKGALGSWSLDVSHGKGKQKLNLMEAADQLEVPAVYGVYMGGRVFRRDLPCLHGSDDPCVACSKMAITLMPALSLSPALGADVLAELAFAEGVPLEDLGDADAAVRIVRDVNFRGIQSEDLRQFLLEAQDGPRGVAKQIFKMVSTRRLGQKSAALAERVDLVGEQVFRALPRDRGHFPVAYFPHVLRGLRRNPPNYVRDLLAGFPPPDEILELVDGIVLVID